MTVAYKCVLIAIILPYIFIIAAKAKSKVKNRDPRLGEAKLTGYQQRAYWAHCNAFEALPAFAAATIIAHLLHYQQNYIDNIAIVFIVCRVLHGIFYIADKPTLRSLAWFIAFACIISMFYLPHA